MPKYREPPTSAWAWVLMVLLFGLLGWLIWLHPYLLLLAPVFIFWNFREKRKNLIHFDTLLKDRQSDSICTFAQHFDCRKTDTWIIRAVYEQLQNYLKSEKDNFPIRPLDDVFMDLKIDDEDFEYDLVTEIAERTGRSLDNAESNPYYGKANIVENLVYFFNAQPTAT
jgi:hypothetical protein